MLFTWTEIPLLDQRVGKCFIAVTGLILLVGHVVFAEAEPEPYQKIKIISDLQQFCGH